MATSAYTLTLVIMKESDMYTPLYSRVCQWYLIRQLVTFASTGGNNLQFKSLNKFDSVWKGPFK
jgi:hypothetical protein